MAKEAKSKDKDITSPPITAVNRALFRRQRATKNGASKCDNAKLVEPIHTVKKEKMCKSVWDQNKNEKKLKRDNLTLLITESDTKN